MIFQLRLHLNAALLGDPGRLNELQGIVGLSAQHNGEHEQPDAADGVADRLENMTDRTLNLRLTQGSFCDLFGEFNAFNFQEFLESHGYVKQLVAGLNRLRPRRSLVAMNSQMLPPAAIWSSRSRRRSTGASR